MYDEILAVPGLSAEQVAFLTAERDRVIRANERKASTLTAHQYENQDFKNDILAVMEDGVDYSVTDLMEKIPSLNCQRMSSLLRQLRAEGWVVKREIKRKPFYAKVAPMGCEG